MKEKASKMLKDKLVLVALVLGLLTMVSAAGIMTVQRGNAGPGKPYQGMPEGELIAQEQPAEETGIAGASETERTQEQAASEEAEHTGLAKHNPNEGNDLAAEAGAGREAADALALNFGSDSSLGWPVRGNVVLDYSMDQTIYFPTLDQYKCSPGIAIQSEVSAPVAAPANARVAEVGSDEEIGNFVVLDLGGDYAVTCGQLKEVSAVEGEYLQAGQTFGYVAEPTKYFSVEGVNLYLKLTYKGEAVDPLSFME